MEQASIENRAELLRRLRGMRSELDRLGVERVGLFGSFHRDQADRDSDVDVLLEFKPGAKSFRALFEVSTLLEESFGRDVEAITPESLSPEMKSAILEDIEYVE